MKKYDVPLALSTTGDAGKLALARMILDMMELYEFYEPLKYKGTFEDLKELDEAGCFRVLGIDSLSEERLKRLEEEFKDEIIFKNYDPALALASAGKIEEARSVMEAVNPKKKLDVSNFESLEKDTLEKAREIQETKNLHDRLFKKLKERNLPHPETPREDKTYLREIVAGWERLGIECRPGYEKYAEKISKQLSVKTRRTFEKQVELGLIDKIWFNKMMRRELSIPKAYGGYGAMLPGQLKFIDYVVCDVGNAAWIIEGKKKKMAIVTV